MPGVPGAPGEAWQLLVRLVCDCEQAWVGTNAAPLQPNRALYWRGQLPGLLPRTLGGHPSCGVDTCPSYNTVLYFGKTHLMLSFPTFKFLVPLTE